MVTVCGLIVENPEKEPVPIPLTGVSVHVAIIDLTAEVKIEQRYVNRESVPIEAVYKFPLDEGAALCKFTAEVDGRVIEGVVKETQTAQAEYQEAIQSGRSAFLVEEKLPDVFKARVGNLAPGSGAKISLTYVTELKTEGGEIRFFLPTTIAPRYVPPNDNSSAAADLSSMTFTTESKYEVEIKADVKMASDIVGVRSPTHDIVTNISDEKKTAAVSLHCQSVAMDRDWVIYVKTAEPHKPRYIAEKSEDGSWALALSIVPSFALAEQKTELIFVVDRSGSMMGQGIEQAKQAMTLFLHSLPADCYVNIVGFGSSYQTLFPQSQKYSDEVLTQSKTHVQSIGADLGGTEIYAPLNWIFEQPTIPDYLRQIFILTDGEVSNADQVLSLVGRNQHNSRVFALGLGESASHHLVEGIARAGNGTALFASFQERLEKKVLQQLQDALQPAMTNVNVSWEGLESRSGEKPVVLETEKTLLGFGKPVEGETTTEKQEVRLLRQAPGKCSPVFDGRHLVVYALLDKSVTDPPGSVDLSAVSPVGPLKARVILSDRTEGKTVHRLAARKLIQELQDRIAANIITEETEKMKKEIIQLGCGYGLASRYTSFIAVDPKQQESLKESWMMMKSRDVPNTLAHGWGGFGRAAPMAFCGPPMAMACSATIPMPMAFGCAPSQVVNFCARPMKMMMKSRCAALQSLDTTEAMDIAFADSRMDTEPEQAYLEAQAKPLEPEVPQTEDDKLMNLVSLQKFNGSFQMDPLLAKLLSVEPQDLQQSGEQLGFQDPLVWATLIALAYMEVVLDKLRDSWTLVYSKAIKWLNSENVNHAEDLKKAEKYVKEKLGKN